MKLSRHILVGLLSALFASSATSAEQKEARVTQIIREVKILPSDAAERDAIVDDKVAEDTGVRTGGDSRSELTFADLTITRLGANTIFSFNKAGRTVNLEGGSVLLRVPKNSGGGSIKNNVVTVAITGTTVILETDADGGARLITLEGTATLSFTNDPTKSRKVRAAQMLDVPAGATRLPQPVNIDLQELIRTHPLIVDFRPLPSLPLIMSVAKQQPQSVTRVPINRGPSTRPPPPGPGPGPLVPPPTGPGPVAGGSGKPPPASTTQPNVTPYPSASPRTRPPRPTPTPSPTPRQTPTTKPSPTPYHTPRPSPTPRWSPKPTATPTPRPTRTPKASPKPTRPPVTTYPSATKPPVLNPKTTPTPIILRKAPTPATTPPTRTIPRSQKTTKTPPPGPR